MANILPLLLLIVCATALSIGMIAVSKVVGPRRNTAVKEMPYESGMDPIHDTRRRFDIHFHLVAIAFLLFDVELLFLYPWAVAVRNPAGIQAAVDNQLIAGRGLVFAEVMIFLAFLTVGYLYAWRKGIFRWR